MASAPGALWFPGIAGVFPVFVGIAGRGKREDGAQIKRTHLSELEALSRLR